MYLDEAKKIETARRYYLFVSENKVLSAKVENDGRVRLTVYNSTFDNVGFIWVEFSGEYMYLQTEIGTHGRGKIEKFI